jgi:hypothetical protein
VSVAHVRHGFVESVLPRVVRVQWTISLPMGLRFLWWRGQRC